MKFFRSISSLIFCLSLSFCADAQEPYKIIPTNKKGISKILFNAAGDQLFISAATKIYRLGVKTEKISTEYEHEWNVVDFSVSADDKRLFSTDGYIQLWDINGSLTERDLGKFSTIRLTTANPDNSGFAFSSKFNLRYYETVSGALQSYKTDNLVITTLAFNDNGPYMAVGYEANGFDIWDVEKKMLVSTFKQKTEEITCFAFSPDAGIVYAGTRDGRIIHWDIASEQVRYDVAGDGTPILAIYQVNKYMILSVDAKGYIGVRESQTGKSVTQLQIENEPFRCLALSPKTLTVAFARSDGDLVLHDLTRYINFSGILSYQILDTINTYVRSQLIDWQEKGKYEKSADYLERVTPENREKKIEELTREITNTCGINLVKSGLQNLRYDPDNELFQLSFEHLKPVYIAVPIEEAPSFEQNADNLEFREIQLMLDDNELLIGALTVRNPENQKIYSTTNNTPATFTMTRVAVNVDDVKIQIPVTEVTGQQVTTQRVIDTAPADVDQNIPETGRITGNVYALVIGNEDYTSFQETLTAEINVDYALNDADIVSKYLNSTFGIPGKNITTLKNATYGQMMRAINKLEVISEISGSEARFIFYYSGHGIPDEKTKEAYLMPVDASATTLESAIKLNDVFSKLTNHPSLGVIAIVDACFSGGGREEGLLAMKSVRIKPADSQLKGKLVVLASSTGEESSGVYRQKHHGLYTYYLLKKLQVSQGEATLKELTDYLRETVELESVLVNNKRQTPQVLVSQDVEQEWATWRLIE